MTRGKPVVVPAKEILKPTTSIVGKKEVDPQGNLLSSSGYLIASKQKESFYGKKIRLLSKRKETNKQTEVGCKMQWRELGSPTICHFN